MPRVGFREFFAVSRVLANGRLSRYAAGENGYTARFEARLGEKMDVNHVLTVNSGTSALITALAAAGIGPGDEVLVPAYTWVATALAPLAVGAVPVLVDIDESLTIDPAEIERGITPQCKAIIPVHMLNLVCDMDAIMDIAKRHNLIVIEDACQCVGVRYKDRRVGAIGDLGAYSFNHYKNVTSGEGGAVLTNDNRHFERARMYHDPGTAIRGHTTSNEPFFSAVSFRVSELTGAVLYAQLSRLDPLLNRLATRHSVVAAAFEDLPHCRVSPHNDPENAVALSVIFDTADQAKGFAEIRGVERMIDTERHVFTNWEAVLSKRAFNAKMNPHNWAHREIDYSPAEYEKTLDILSRTCRVALGPQFPVQVMRYRKKVLRAAAEKLVKNPSPTVN